MRIRVVSLHAAALLFSGLFGCRDEGEALPPPPPLPPPSEQAPAPSAELGAIRFDETRGAYVAPYGEGTALLTLHPDVQAQVQQDLDEARPLFGATVVLEARTGRILALAEHTSRTPERPGVALRADAPAASIFKLVAAAALLENGVRPDERVCFSGGKRRLQPKHLTDRRRDRCMTFADVVPLSLNAAIAKLVDRKLPEGALMEMAERLGFGSPLPFPLPVEPSLANIPADRFERAKAAAGFGDVRLSALHAAMLTAVIANRGIFVPPLLIDRVEGGPAPAVEPPRRVLDSAFAELLARMMADTVTRGTARRFFADRRRSPLAGVSVGAKTGSLLIYEERIDYSWLVTFAPVDDPEIVAVTVIANDWMLWYAKAHPLARSALEAGLKALWRERTAEGSRAFGLSAVPG